jgi:fructose 1,6-bisphosphatase
VWTSRPRSCRGHPPRLSLIAGRYVGKNDPVCIVRCQSQFPAVGEVLEPFATAHIVEGWMRGSHFGPLMPVSVDEATPGRFDGLPRVIALGFQLAGGRLVGPRDLFDDPAFDARASPFLGTRAQPARRRRRGYPGMGAGGDRRQFLSF